MAAPIDSQTVITKLLEKTEAGRIEWSASGRTFVCFLEDKYRFEIRKDDDIYTILMMDDHLNQIFTESALEELIFNTAGDREKFEKLRDLHELARRIAFDVDKKVAGVSDLLDKI